MKSSKGTSPVSGTPYEFTEVESQSSVECALNAKGEITVAVKVYDILPGAAAADAVAVLKNTCAKLREEGFVVAGDRTKA